MTLGDILQSAAVKDLSGLGKNKLLYMESVKDGKFWIKLSSMFEEGFLECQLPNDGTEEEKNYLRVYFLSMVYNAAIHGMKRMKHTKNKNKKR